MTFDRVPEGVLVAANIAAWFIWSVLVGYAGHRWPLQAFERDTWWSRLRGFERDRRFYARVFRIHTWKDQVPELGGLFPGGFAKRRVDRSPSHLRRFAAETRRAEAVHWIVFWLWPVFALWNPPWAVVVMLGYAIVANIPCALVQRYNRGRLLAALQRCDTRANRQARNASLARS
ncbi:MAG: hypothetical protein IT178_01185 [Acidobacteria bacterium]|nr:hypothetical protein [Acidobacteriota bacterium]